MDRFVKKFCLQVPVVPAVGSHSIQCVPSSDHSPREIFSWAITISILSYALSTILAIRLFEFTLACNKQSWQSSPADRSSPFLPQPPEFLLSFFSHSLLETTGMLILLTSPKSPQLSQTLCTFFSSNGRPIPPHTAPYHLTDLEMDFEISGSLQGTQHLSLHLWNFLPWVSRYRPCLSIL